MNVESASARKQALILFAHGARDPAWATPFRTIRNLVAARRPGVLVECAYLEFMTPSLEEALGRVTRAQARRVTIAPLFMAQGGHLRNDLPRLLDELRERYPGVVIELLPPAGEAESVLGAISDWLIGALKPD